jgi:hypothetical protein
LKRYSRFGLSPGCSGICIRNIKPECVSEIWNIAGYTCLVYEIYYQFDILSKKYSHFDTSVLNRLKKALNINTDSELADFLGIKPTAIANWRSRGRINATCIISKCELLDINWIFFGKSFSGERNRNVSTYDEREEIIEQHNDNVQLVHEIDRERANDRNAIKLENIRLKSKIEVLEDLIIRLKKDKSDT